MLLMITNKMNVSFLRLIDYRFGVKCYAAEKIVYGGNMLACIKSECTRTAPTTTIKYGKWLRWFNYYCGCASSCLAQSCVDNIIEKRKKKRYFTIFYHLWIQSYAACCAHDANNNISTYGNVKFLRSLH